MAAERLVLGDAGGAEALAAGLRARARSGVGVGRRSPGSCATSAPRGDAAVREHAERLDRVAPGRR